MRGTDPREPYFRKSLLASFLSLAPKALVTDSCTLSRMGHESLELPAESDGACLYSQHSGGSRVQGQPDPQMYASKLLFVIVGDLPTPWKPA